MDRTLITTRIERFPLKSPFSIAGKTWDCSEALIVTAKRGGAEGRGEAQGVFYRGETAALIKAQADEAAATLGKTVSRESLHEALPPGGARNALDCALWDLEAKLTGRSVFDQTKIRPRALTTFYTIGLEASIDEMAAKAEAAGDAPILKVKLNEDRPVERMRAIRQVRPEAQLVIDANCAWTFEALEEYAAELARLGVAMVEQPLPRGDDAVLEGFQSPIPLCADESCLDRSDLAAVRGRYQMINIKLDKTGGLTEALALAGEAQSSGLGLMVGNMLGSSLAMAPGFLIGCLCAFIDLDGPMLLARDTAPGLSYKGSTIMPPDPAVWG